MTAKRWKSLIVKQMKKLEVYDESYKSVIQTLANILEQRDLAYEKFVSEGSHIYVTHTNKFGASNMAKNPLLIMWDDMNKTALTYWKELGLTPQSLKKITGGKPKEVRLTGLASALAELEKG